MAEYVLDASALVKALLDEEGSDRFRAWHLARLHEGSETVAPHLLGYEMAQVGRRVGRYADAVALVDGMPLHEGFAALAPYLDQLSAYDAAYLAVAAALGAPLVTYDGAMQAAARRHGIQVLAP